MTFLFRFLVLFLVMATSIDACAAGASEGAYIVAAWVAIGWAASGGGD